MLPPVMSGYHYYSGDVFVIVWQKRKRKVRKCRETEF